MSSTIIFPNDHGGIALCYPFECGLTIEQIARKDVPAGKPFLIVPNDQVPKDKTFFDAFEADFSNPHGVGIGTQAWFIEQYTAEISAINAEPMPARLPDRDQTTEEYDAVVAHWEASKAARIEQLNNQIATQQAEMAA